VAAWGCADERNVMWDRAAAEDVGREGRPRGVGADAQTTGQNDVPSFSRKFILFRSRDKITIYLLANILTEVK
jgi:hypothetical protein